VLDPFCGSGTVLVEARRLERFGVGVDANPLAIELSWLKTRGLDASEVGAIEQATARIVELAEDRRARKLGPTERYGPVDRELFDIHVLLELDGLRAGIRAETVPDLRRLSFLVLSSVLTKVSRKRGDTGMRGEARRLASGYTIRLFSKKAAELCRRMREFQELLAPSAPRPYLRVGDARNLAAIDPVQLVVTSPPYPGVYDYADQHRDRLRWLGLDARRFTRAEIGSRRGPSGLPGWQRDFSQVLTQLAAVLSRGGHAVVVIADSVLEGRPLYADDQLRQLAPAAGLMLVAGGSQQRPHFHGPTKKAFARRPRREHAFVLGTSLGTSARGQSVARGRTGPAKPRRASRDRGPGGRAE
jgi:hypothetical protein